METVTTADVNTKVESHTRQPPRSGVMVLFWKSSLITKMDSGYVSKMGASWNDVRGLQFQKEKWNWHD